MYLAVGSVLDGDLLVALSICIPPFLTSLFQNQKLEQPARGGSTRELGDP